MCDDTEVPKHTFCKAAFDDDEVHGWGVMVYLVPRLVTVLSAVGAGFFLERQEGGGDLPATLSATFIATVSVLASWWFAVAAVSIVPAALLLWIRTEPWGWTRLRLRWIWLPKYSALRDDAAQALLQFNRQVGHIEALFTWVALALLGPPLLWERTRLDTHLGLLGCQLGAAAAVFAFGGLLADGIAWWRPRPSGDLAGGSRLGRLCARIRSLRMPDREAWDRERLHWERRPVLFLFILVGVIAVVCLAPRQWRAIFELAIVVVVGAILRTFSWHRAWAQRSRDDLESQHSKAVAQGRRYLDAAVICALAVLVVAITAWSTVSLRGPGSRDRRERSAICKRCDAVENPEQRDIPRSSETLAGWCRDAVRPDTGHADVALFLVSDIQFHELSGEPSGLQSSLVESVVQEASRPVELDLLAGATLSHFADLYRHMRDDGRKPGEPPRIRWASLGDVGDVGCLQELNRFVDAAGEFGAADLAGLVPGNHDVSFLGNLFWHPDWGRACKGKPARRKEAFRVLRRLLRSARVTPGTDTNGVLAMSEGGGFLASLSRLGKSDGRDVLGLFLDTTDSRAFQLGLAGVQGSISLTQIGWASDQLARHPDALVVLFLHHPLAALRKSSRDAVEKELALPLGNRLLLVVSGHTHLAAHRARGVDQPLEEMIIGSTIDPPQEAAVLEVGHTGDRHWARVRTVPAVELQDLVCQPKPAGAIQAKDCIELRASLSESKCVLSREAARELHREELERQHSDSPCARRHPDESPWEIRCQNQARAWSLWRCLVPAGEEGAVPPLPLDRAEAANELAAMAGAASGHRRLVCLSWAASILQHEKREKWDMARAWAFAFDQAATYGELAVFFPERTASPVSGHPRLSSKR